MPGQYTVKYEYRDSKIPGIQYCKKVLIRDDRPKPEINFGLWSGYNFHPSDGLQGVTTLDGKTQTVSIEEIKSAFGY